LRSPDGQAKLAPNMKLSPTAIATTVLLGIAAIPTASRAAPVGVERSAQRPVVQIIQVSGTVTSPQSAVLSTSVGGLIERIDVDAGDQVEAGAILVALDRELGNLDLERVRAEEAQARSELEDSRRRLREAERIGPERGIPESQIKSLRAEVVRDEAALAAATAAARQQAAVVRRHDVRAPFSGVISERFADVGEWVDPGDGLVELVATDKLRFDFRVPQTHYTRIDMSTVVELSLDALPESTLSGRIQAIVPVKDPGARTFLLRVVANADTPVMVTPGMSARAKIRVDTGREAVVVPRDALLLYPDGRKTVWIADQGAGETTVHEQRVETGLEFDGLVEIREGLDAGVVVVTRGNEALQNGQVVQVR
jgi:membrane fusion protein (multidrug efflux system)